MKLKSGDLVTVTLNEVIILYDVPFHPLTEAKPLAHLTNSDTAVVVSLSNYDGRSVYIVGPHGAGWTFGGYLKKIDSNFSEEL